MDYLLYYEKTITTNIIGEESVYTISQEFENSLSLNTSTGPANITTFMEIRNLEEDTNMSFEIETRRTNLNSSCPNYDDDCNVIVTHIYDSTRKILSDKPTTIGDKENFTLFKSPVINFIEYKIECVENSCPQRINSNITLSEIR